MSKATLGWNACIDAIMGVQMMIENIVLLVMVLTGYGWWFYQLLRLLEWMLRRMNND